jgi:hypothetical protein
MTLEEAILHALDKEKTIECKACAKEHGELATWLLELKHRREMGGSWLVKCLNESLLNDFKADYLNHALDPAQTVLDLLQELKNYRRK